ncbi:Vacuolar protein sorting-associated protein 4A-like 2 [Homarus americanus]|uniref:Vacuolar protein sorting-associated protein 4A-like 2 n=2 Tax=Homarus americanus TaxID=6706 RepID=A0A8J5NBA8_HOMAM|nr:Vacuolar protein sorting-associated protein 4A-like 2 [Homarus americanus]
MDLELFEALLANMQNLPQGAYDEVDDDDDDDYEDDDDDDDDDDYDYGGHEHNIHTMANPYGGGGEGAGGMAGGEMGGVSLPTMQTMSILQGLLNMNPAALPGGVPDMGGGMSGPMSSGMPGMGAPMDGGAGSFLSNMPSFLPAMNPEMAGTLAGAFAGGMNALMDGFAGGNGGGGATVQEYDDDELLSDEEDEDDDEDEEMDERSGLGSVAVATAGVAAVGAVGGLMASGMLGSSHPSVGHPVHSPHPGHMQHRGHSPLPGHHQHPGNALLPAHGSHPGHPPPLGFVHGYNSADMLSQPTSHPHMSPSIAGPIPSMHHTNMAPSISGGSVRSVDPLAGVSMGLAGMAAGAGILAPVVSNLLSSSVGRSLPKLDNSDASSVTLVGDDSLNTSTKTLPPPDHPADPNSVAAAAAALEKLHISPPEKDVSKPIAKLGPATTPKKDAPKEKNEENDSEGEEEDEDESEPTEEAAKPTRVSAPKDDLEDDKASVGADSVPGSEEAGDGKSDTESVRKKTPSPVLVDKLGRLSPTGSDSSPVLESASCASITDLASATESMRDSDTDNHSDAHNVTANLSDLDNDIHETQPKVRAPPQYAVGALPVVIEKPTFGWQSMVGLDTAKDALKNLFLSEAFPEVYEGTLGTCKGVLLFGPSGSGKTCLARALAKEANDAVLIGISTGYLAQQPPLEAPKIVRFLFDHARMQGSAVILFDEVDALCYDRSSETALRAKAELLAQIRGMTTLNPPYPPHIDTTTFNSGIMVLGTTNQPWLLEDELRRIFTYNIHVKLPGEKAREELLRMFLQALPHNINDDQFKCLVAKSEGYSAADINNVVRQVAHMPPSEPNKYIQNTPRAVTYDDLATVMTDYRCKFTEDVSVKYQSYIKAATHRSEGRREDAKSEEKGKPKGVKRFGQRIAKSIAAALVAVID